MEDKKVEKTAEELKNECSQITQEILSLASLGDIMRAKEICEKVMQYGWDMYQQGADKVLTVVNKAVDEKENNNQ